MIIVYAKYVRISRCKVCTIGGGGGEIKKLRRRATENDGGFEKEKEKIKDLGTRPAAPFVSEMLFWRP